ncbi:MAG: T9SS type A sorting domain-containing protein [Candidatus Eisenbacteria bacterium]|uniref:T9SS type A sorting domain-containing protein n=1 Tax=Eiseniibacteriota bacterium TaxID=2212470 RepID=A0A849SQ37_UNCEI|nr:T9SS type A sorting domain-containing protein [Candidatus Eisenbacteria bacterium]
MPSCRRLALLLLALTIGLNVIPAATASGAWSNTGNPLADSNDQEELVKGPGFPGTTVCPDGGGGLICVYVVDDQSLSINRLDEATGAKRWGATGVDVTGVGEIQNSSSPFVVSDLHGGAWVGWLDIRAGTPGFYVQRFDSLGVAQFAAGGIRVGTSSTEGFGFDTRADGALYVAFSQLDVRFQLIQMNGTLSLGASGVQVSTQDPGSVSLRRSAANQAVIAWTSFQPIAAVSRHGLFTNKVNEAGARQWDAGGVTVRHNASVNVTGANLAVDAAGLAHFAWEENDGVIDLNGEALPIRAQKLNAAGAAQWGASGVLVHTPPNTPWDLITVQAFPRLIVDGSGSAVIGWLDGRDFDRVAADGFEHATDIYAQRLDVNGALLWGANGAAIDSLTGTQRDLFVVGGPNDGAIFVYRTLYVVFDGDIQARRFDGNATQVWNRTVTPVIGTDGVQEMQSAASDGVGGVVIAWQDERNDPPSGADIFATHRQASNGNMVTPSITLTFPDSAQSFTALEPITVTWTGQNLGSSLIQVDVLIAGVPQAASPVPNPTTNDGSFTLWVPDVATTEFKVRVSAVGTSATDQSLQNSTVCRSLVPTFASTTVSAASDIASTDFDGDGILDLVISEGDTVQLRRGGGAAGVGDGSFTASEVLLALGATPVQRIALADLDEDGRPDLIGTGTTGIRVWMGNGSSIPRLDAAVTFDAGVSSFAVATADLNADGMFDLVVSRETSPFGVRVLIGNGTGGVGNGSFGAATGFGASIVGRDLVIADFNEDRALDVAMCGQQSALLSNGGFAVMLGTLTNGLPSGTMGAASAINFGLEQSARMVSGDFEDDGRLDLAIASQLSLRVLKGGGTGATGNGTFTMTQSTVSNTVVDVVATDLNRDGITDLMVGDGVWSGGPTPMFGPAPLTKGQPIEMQSGGLLVTGDFLEDGRPDLAGVRTNLSRLNVWTGVCDWTLDSPIAIVAPDTGQAVVRGFANFYRMSWNNPAGLQAVDLELSRDGGATWELIANDLIESVYNWRVVQPDAQSALLRITDVHHSTRSTVSGAFKICPAFSAALDLTTFKVNQVTTADFNEDGFQDLAYASTDDLHVRLSNGAGGYPSDLVIPTALAVLGITTADIDDDGIVDLVGTNANGLVSARGLGAAGIGNGTFAASSNLSLGGRTTKIASADFDEDGIADLVSVQPALNRIAVLLGNGVNGDGDGTFVQTFYTVGTRPSDVAIADVNRDGIHDLLVTNQSDGTLSTLLGQGTNRRGNGLFGAPIVSAAGTAPLGLVVGSFDVFNDISDVLVIDSTATGALRMLQGQGNLAGGNGSYTLMATVPLANQPADIALTDLNADRRSDFAILFQTGGVDAYVRTDDFSFSAASFALYQQASTISAGSSLAVADLDRNGSPDLVASTLNVGHLYVFSGPCPNLIQFPDVVSYPNVGISLEVGFDSFVLWSTFFSGAPIDVELSHDAGANWEPIARHVTYASNFFQTSTQFSPTPPATTQALVRICDSYVTSRCDTLNGVFTITQTTTGTEVSVVPARLELSNAWPNPSSGPVALRLALPKAASIDATIYDVAGRRVASLADGRRDAGWHLLQWDGRRDDGGIAGSGVYLVRARGEGFDFTRRVIRTR